MLLALWFFHELYLAKLANVPRIFQNNLMDYGIQIGILRIPITQSNFGDLCRSLDLRIFKITAVIVNINIPKNGNK